MLRIIKKDKKQIYDVSVEQNRFSANGTLHLGLQPLK